jgi:hypothetical protein
MFVKNINLKVQLIAINIDNVFNHHFHPWMQNRTEHKDMGISHKQTPLETMEHQSWGHGHS